MFIPSCAIPMMSIVIIVYMSYLSVPEIPTETRKTHPLLIFAFSQQYRHIRACISRSATLSLRRAKVDETARMRICAYRPLKCFLPSPRVSEDALLCIHHAPSLSLLLLPPAVSLHPILSPSYFSACLYAHGAQFSRQSKFQRAHPCVSGVPEVKKKIEGIHHANPVCLPPGPLCSTC